MNRKIKVFYLINSLCLGGAEKFLLSMVKYINKEKFKPIVCYIEKDEALLNEFKKTKAELICLNLDNKLDIRSITRLFTVLKNHKPDILHTHLAYSSIIGRIIGKILKVPIIISHQHNTAYILNYLSLFLEKITIPLADLVICVAEGVELSFFKKAHVFSIELLEMGYKHFTIYNSIDVDEIEEIIKKTDSLEKRKNLGLNKEDKVISIVARLTKGKGHHNLIHAFYEVHKTLPSSKLLIVGDGELRKELELITHKLGIANSVIFCGSRNDVYEILKITDVFVLPYDYNLKKSYPREGVGIAILEAMAACKPVITTENFNSTRGIVKNGINALIVPVNDSKALSNAILEILTNDEKAKFIAENGYRLVKENFSISKKIKEYEMIYEFLFDRFVKN